VRWQPPASLRTLVMGYYFNLPASQLRLPSGLTDLDMGQQFNHPLREMTWPHAHAPPAGLDQPPAGSGALNAAAAASLAKSAGSKQSADSICQRR